MLSRPALRRDEACRGRKLDPPLDDPSSFLHAEKTCYDVDGICRQDRRCYGFDLSNTSAENGGDPRH